MSVLRTLKNVEPPSRAPGPHAALLPDCASARPASEPLSRTSRPTAGLCLEVLPWACAWRLPLILQVLLECHHKPFLNVLQLVFPSSFVTVPWACFFPSEHFCEALVTVPLLPLLRREVKGPVCLTQCPPPAPSTEPGPWEALGSCRIDEWMSRTELAKGLIPAPGDTSLGAVEVSQQKEELVCHGHSELLAKSQLWDLPVGKARWAACPVSHPAATLGFSQVHPAPGLPAGCHVAGVW